MEPGDGEVFHLFNKGFYCCDELKRVCQIKDEKGQEFILVFVTKSQVMVYFFK